MEYVFPEPMSGCWLWDGCTYTDKRKRVKPYYRGMLAHRVAMWLLVGPFPLEKFICHDCDNPHCVNPDHLYVGDHKTNMADMARRKRSYFAKNPEIARESGRRLNQGHSKGEGNPKAKLSKDQAAFIRNSVEKTKLLAERFGVDRTTIQRIRRGALWPS